MDNKGEITY